MKRRAQLVTWLICFAAYALLAQQAPGNDVPATKEDILNLFAAMDTQEQVRQVMNQVMAQSRAMSREAIKRRHPSITQEELTQMDKESEEIARNFPVNELIEDMVPVYQKHLSKADVDAMIGFYSSPTGKKLLHEMPAITAEGMQAVYPRLQKNMDDILRRMDEKASAQPKKPIPAQTPPADKK
jgi:hypothetical protein